MFTAQTSIPHPHSEVLLNSKVSKISHTYLQKKKKKVGEKSSHVALRLTGRFSRTEGTRFGRHLYSQMTVHSLLCLPTTENRAKDNYSCAPESKKRAGDALRGRDLVTQEPISVPCLLKDIQSLHSPL